MSDKGTKGLRALMCPNGPYAGKERVSDLLVAVFTAGVLIWSGHKASTTFSFSQLGFRRLKGRMMGVNNALTLKMFTPLRFRIYVVFFQPKLDFSKMLTS